MQLYIMSETAGWTVVYVEKDIADGLMMDDVYICIVADEVWLVFIHVKRVLVI